MLPTSSTPVPGGSSPMSDRSAPIPSLTSNRTDVLASPGYIISSGKTCVTRCICTTQTDSPSNTHSKRTSPSCSLASSNTARTDVSTCRGKVVGITSLSMNRSPLPRTPSITASCVAEGITAPEYSAGTASCQMIDATSPSGSSCCRSENGSVHPCLLENRPGCCRDGAVRSHGSSVPVLWPKEKGGIRRGITVVLGTRNPA